MEAFKVKLRNPPRRVLVAKLDNGKYIFHFQTLEGWKDIKNTIVKLSPEAVCAMVECLQRLGPIGEKATDEED